MANQMSVHFSSVTDQHNTPAALVDKITEFLGGIGLDPATNAGNPCKATHFYTPETDGLSHLWIADTVYLNPPYGRNIGKWTSKLARDYRQGRIGQAVALLPARTDTKWWFDIRLYPVCFFRGRLKFNDCNQSAPFPSALVYLGDNWQRFNDHFGGYGQVYVPIQKAAQCLNT